VQRREAILFCTEYGSKRKALQFKSIHILPKLLINIYQHASSAKSNKQCIFNVPDNRYIEVLPSALLEFIIGGQSPHHAIPEKKQKPTISN